VSRDFPGTAGNYFNIGSPTLLDFRGLSFSVHAWVNRDVDALLGAWHTSGNRPWLLQATSTQTSFSIQRGAGNDTVITGSVMAAGAWHPIGGRYDDPNNLIKVYAGGAGVQQATASAAITDTGAIEIGRAADAVFTDGLMAEVVLWRNVVLSDADFLSLAAGVSPFAVSSPPSAYWPLCGLQSPEPDLANSNSATMVGTVPAGAHPLANIACNDVASGAGRIGWPRMIR
jgi:hypothetical protein